MTMVSRLPQTRGRYRENAELAKSNWFQVGGPAEVLFKPEDTEDLAFFLKHKPKDIPVTVIGVGSNLIVRDGGIDGVVIRLGRGFAECYALNHESGNMNHEVSEREAREAVPPPLEGGGQVGGENREMQAAEMSPLPNPPPQGGRGLLPETLLYAGAGCLDVNVAQVACEAGLAGLEFLSGIPGTIGGALAMNGGAYGREIADVLVEVEAVTPEGEIKRVKPEIFNYSYRHAEVPEGWIFTGAWLRGEQGDKVEIAARMRQIQTEREASQPIRSRTGGSTFKNPDGKKAWQLVEQAGCRGLRVGDAEMSQKHCNFMINHGGATAADLEALGEEVRRQVKAKTGVQLEWEIRRIGKVL